MRLINHHNKKKSKMDFDIELKKRVSTIEEWLKECKIGSTFKKTKDIAWDMMRPCSQHNITENDILIIKEKLKQTPFTFEPGNLWEHLSEHFHGNYYVEFFKDISNLTPPGLNTSPNACCGKFELLYRLLRPGSKQPKKGDIMDNGEICEMKGCDVRILDTELTGTEYKKNCTKIFKGHIEGNTVTKGGLKGDTAYEIEKPQHKEHYQKEFEKDTSKLKELIPEYLNINGWVCTDKEIDIIFEGGRWNQETMNKLILKKMFIKYQQKKEFNKMYIFGNGTDVKIITDAEDLDKIQITGDFFRINQSEKVGWYIA